MSQFGKNPSPSLSRGGWRSSTVHVVHGSGGPDWAIATCIGCPLTTKGRVGVRRVIVAAQATTIRAVTMPTWTRFRRAIVPMKRP